jgi:hypothetical protein
MLSARFLVQAMYIGTVSATACYVIQDGQCGESDVPNWAIGFAQATTPGLQRGSCVDNGYPTLIGTTEVDGGLLGTITTDLYAPEGTSICGGDDLSGVTTACAAYDSVSDPAVCGTPCQAAAAAALDSDCLITGDIREILDGVTSTCDGYVDASARTCNAGLYLSAHFAEPRHFAEQSQFEP